MSVTILSALNEFSLDFIQRALLGGIGIAIIAGPLGSVIVWRRMANFGDALGHSMLLGVVFAFLLNLNLYMGLFIITLFFAASIAILSYQKQIAPEALLTMLAQTTLALGLILATTLKGVKIDLLEYIFGDILAVENTDLLWIYAIVIISGALLIWIWRPLLSITIHQDLAYVEGTNVMIVHWLLIIILALVFAVAMKLVGVLLITALLIIPAAAARKLSRTPEQMALIASIIGIFSVILGVEASSHADWPTGPAIVVASFVLFLLSFFFGHWLFRQSFFSRSLFSRVSTLFGGLNLFLLVFFLFLTFISPKLSAFTLEEATIDSIHEAFQSHEITCQDLVRAYFDRIQKYNVSVGDKAPLNALTQINPYLFEEAKKLDDDFEKTKKLSGPLHCVPIILKDNIDSFETNTTAGSYAMLGNQPVIDAFLVSKLRDAGGIILAKGGMDEFGWSLYGISSRIGRIGNAYDTDQNPGGSSAGVAAAISANFGVIGIGTDNAGSIRIPSGFNGVHGLRPSTGLVSQRGVFPMGNLDAVAGPITRSIRDLAIVLSIIANEPDPLDPKTRFVPRTKNYTQFLNNKGLKGKRIGIIRQVEKHDTFRNMPQEVENVFNQAFRLMQAEGAILIDNINLTDYNIDRTYNQAGETEDLNDYFVRFPGTRQSFQDICTSDRTRTFGSVKQCLKFAKDNPKRGGSEFIQVLNTFQQNKIYVENIMEENQLDALLMPICTNGSATYDRFTMNTWYSPVASNAGLPGIVINAGYDPRNSLPVGIELIGKQYQEGPLIELAYAYETNSPARILPKLNISKLKFTMKPADMNNLFTLLGRDTYDRILRDLSWQALTPEIFTVIFTERMTDWKNYLEER